jgi:hypothetical protein
MVPWLRATTGFFGCLSLLVALEQRFPSENELPQLIHECRTSHNENRSCEVVHRSCMQLCMHVNAHVVRLCRGRVQVGQGAERAGGKIQLGGQRGNPSAVGMDVPEILR